MSTKPKLAALRRGGAIWLLLIIAISSLWVSPLSAHYIIVLGWMLVGLAFAVVCCLQRIIDRNILYEVVKLQAVLSLIAGIAVYAVERVSWRMVTEASSGYAHLYPVIIALLIVIAGIILLLSTVLVRAAASRMGRSALLAEAWRLMSAEPRIWPFALLSSAAWSLAASAPYGWLPVAGVAAALMQAKLLASVNTNTMRSSAGLCNRPEPNRQRLRRTLLGIMLGFHAIVYLFYVVLYVIAGEAGVWRSISGYPVLWISGLIIALIAWLFGHLWILYMIVLISVIILCLALLGLTIGLFGFDLPDTIF